MCELGTARQVIEAPTRDETRKFFRLKPLAAEPLAPPRLSVA